MVIIGFLAWNSKLASDISPEKVRELPVRKIVEDIEAKEKAKSDSVLKAEKELKVAGLVNIAISAIDKTWLRFIKDNKDTVEYTLYAGNKINIKADSSVQFLIGNAGGLEFEINGVDKGRLGKKGEVISYLKITPSGITAMLTKVINNEKVQNDTTDSN